jgi:two-component system, chemotaxis family, chemotaxis protein CheY
MAIKSEYAGLSIVVVDDSDFSRSLITKMLREEGFNVVAEASGAEAALQIIHEKKPNVLITDIVMPDISGIELTEKVTKSYDISVIVISSLSQEHVVLEAIGAGAADFIAKPIDPEQLKDSLKKIAQQINKDNK